MARPPNIEGHAVMPSLFIWWRDYQPVCDVSDGDRIRSRDNRSYLSMRRRARRYLSAPNPPQASDVGLLGRPFRRTGTRGFATRHTVLYAIRIAAACATQREGDTRGRPLGLQHLCREVALYPFRSSARLLLRRQERERFEHTPVYISGAQHFIRPTTSDAGPTPLRFTALKYRDTA